MPPSLSPAKEAFAQLDPQKIAAVTEGVRIGPPCEVMSGELPALPPWPFAQWTPSIGGSCAPCPVVVSRLSESVVLFTAPPQATEIAAARIHAFFKIPPCAREG